MQGKLILETNEYIINAYRNENHVLHYPEQLNTNPYFRLSYIRPLHR